MHRAIALGMAAAVASVVYMPSIAASGGGWWTGIDLDRRHIAPGETIQLDTEVYWQNMSDAEAAREGDVENHLFLIPDVDAELIDRVYRLTRYKRGWWTPQPGSIDLGMVELSRWDSNIAQARISFTVPEIEAGTYSFMLCSPGCTHEMGNMVPTQVSVVASAAHAKAADRIDELKIRISQRNWEFRRAKRKLRKAHNELKNASETQDLGPLEDRLDEMDERISVVASAGEEPPSSGPDSGVMSGVIFGVLLGAAGALVLGRRRPEGTDHHERDALGVEG